MVKPCKQSYLAVVLCILCQFQIAQFDYNMSSIVSFRGPILKSFNTIKLIWFRE